jgi:hypothetical protein
MSLSYVNGGYLFHHSGDTTVLRALDRESVNDEFRISARYTLVKWNKVKSIKTIHSRSNKDIGDVIEEEWEITAKRVIAEPRSGGNGQIPRFGIYEYEVKPIIRRAADKPTFAKQQNEPGVGGTRREASSVPLTVRRTS